MTLISRPLQPGACTTSPPCASCQQSQDDYQVALATWQRANGKETRVTRVEKPLLSSRAPQVDRSQSAESPRVYFTPGEDLRRVNQKIRALVVDSFNFTESPGDNFMGDLYTLQRSVSLISQERERENLERSRLLFRPLRHMSVLEDGKTLYVNFPNREREYFVGGPQVPLPTVAFETILQGNAASSRRFYQSAFRVLQVSCDRSFILEKEGLVLQEDKFEQIMENERRVLATVKAILGDSELTSP